MLIQTLGFCVNGTIGGGAYATASGCLVKDVTGRKSLLLSAGPGSGITASGTLGAFAANAVIADLAEWFEAKGASVTAGIYTGGIDVATGPVITT